MHRVYPVIFLLLVNCVAVFAQPLNAYVNIQGELMVWDRGLVHKVDYLAPTEMKIGRSAIAFLDNSRSFKIYYGGGVKTINNGFTNAFATSDNLVAFLNQKSLNVFDRGTVKNLTGICDQYTLGDSVLLYLDAVKSEYKVYYNGQSYVIESFITDSGLTKVKVSDNIVAYCNFSNQFRIFYKGNIIAQEDYPVGDFKAGRNTVAYVDANRQFKIFHNGQTFVIDDYPPTNFAVGDNLVAFVSNDGYFKVFYEDSVRSIGFFNPTYKVGDNVIAYKDPGGMFKAFYKGTITDIDTYYPTNYVVQYNSLAYVNVANTLKLFTEGEIYEVTSSDLENWQLNYDVIKYQIGQAIFKIYYKGLEY